MENTEDNTKPRISELLSQVATVAYITTTAVGVTRLDKDASKLADQQHAAVQGAGRLYASRFAGCEERVKEIKSVQAAAHDLLKQHTTQWGRNRLLMNQFIQPFMQEYMGLKNQHDQLHQRLIADAPALIQRAQQNKGTYNVDPVTEDELRDGFSLDFRLEAVPDTANFKATGLDSKVEEVLRRRIEADMQAAYQQSQKDLVERLKGPLGNLADRMEAYSQREKDKDTGKVAGGGVFRDTVVENVTKITKLIEACNVTGDPVLNDLVDKLSALDGIEANDLRKDGALRDDTARRAREILEGLGGWS